MTSIPKSGYSYPNHAARTFLVELENLVGKNGVSALLNSAHLEAWITALPADDGERGVDFAEFSALLAALDDLYGPRGGRGLARRAGWAAFPQIIARMDALKPLADLPTRHDPWRREAAARTAGVGRCLQSGQRPAVHVSPKTERRSSSASSAARHAGVGRRKTARRAPRSPGFSTSASTGCSAASQPAIEETECLAHGGTACSFRLPKPAA